MKLQYSVGSKGNILVVVAFEGCTNFNKDKLTWVPTLDEIIKIYDAVATSNALAKDVYTRKLAEIAVGSEIS